MFTLTLVFAKNTPFLFVIVNIQQQLFLHSLVALSERFLQNTCCCCCCLAVVLLLLLSVVVSYCCCCWLLLLLLFLFLLVIAAVAVVIAVVVGCSVVSAFQELCFTQSSMNRRAESDGSAFSEKKWKSIKLRQQQQQ